MEEKTLTERAKETLVYCMERSEADPEAVAELGKAYAAIITAEVPGNTIERMPELLSMIENL